MFSGTSEISLTLVADIGPGSLKVGHGGEDVPRAWIPTVYGKRTSVAGAGGDVDMERKAGSDIDLNLDRATPGMEVVPSIVGDDIVDWDAVQTMFESVFKEQLMANPALMPILIGHRALMSPECRHKLCELMFEYFQSPAVFLGKDAVLTLFANARTSGIVLDVGYDSTRCAPVQDGYVITQGVTKSDIGGRTVDEYLLALLESRGLNIPTRFGAAAPAGVTPSFLRYHKLETIRDMKETICRIDENRFDEATAEKIPTAAYTLPDGAELEVGADRYRAPEIFFAPAEGQRILRSTGKMVALPDLLFSTVQSVSLDARKDLLGNIVLTGGGLCNTGGHDRLMKDVALSMQEIARTRVVAAPPTERRLGVWLGGSILASLNTFHDMWFSASEYHEHGVKFVDTKCP